MADGAHDRIPILDLQPEIEEIWPELSAKLEEVVRSGQFIMGPESRAFEEEAAEFLGVKHAIGVNSGTDALVIAMRSAGIEAGDEVITSPFSFFASAESISIFGAKPMFADINLDSMNMDPDALEAAITPRTKAVMPVHIFGRPCEMNRIMAIAEKHGLKVIEDCAQSFGARYEGCPGCELPGCASSPHMGKATGGIGDAGAFSFYPTKNLGAYGDAGLITTNDDAIAETSRKLRTHGSTQRYHNELLGYNSRLDSIQAAILRIKLRRLPDCNSSRRAAAARYNELLAGIEGIITPPVTPGHIFHQYTIRITEASRDAVQASLNEQGVSSIVYYPFPQNRLPVYDGQYPEFANSELLASQVLSLPLWPQISEGQQERVAEAIRKALA